MLPESHSVNNETTETSFSTDSPQYKNASISDFVLAMPFKIKKINEVCNFESDHIILTHLLTYSANGNTKLALVPLLLILCVCENLG